jgi:polyhydroxybutyrate depolymerase
MRARRPGSLFAFTFLAVGAIGCMPGDAPNGNSGAGGSGSGTAGSSAAGATGSGSGGSTGSAGVSGSGTAGNGASGVAGTSGSGDTNGGGGSGGNAAVGGGSGTAGVTVGSAGTSGSGGAGPPGAAGRSAAGGQAGTNTAGRGGSGAGGTTGAGGGGGTAPANPSGGCGKANPAVGTSSSPLMVSSHKYYVKLPTGYDANKPYPLLFMFNPTGNPITWAEQNAGYENNGAKAAAIRVYPHPLNESSGWGAGDVSFFQPLYDQVTAAYCVDKARVFAAGESSGGDFSSILGCEHANKLRAIAPCATKDVSAYPLNATTRKCTGQVTAIVIHGKNDNVVGPANGPKTRDFYVALNHCATTTPAPQPVAGYTDTLSNCLQYQGCDAGFPVYWCNHTDPNYSNTNHGWPAFAANMTWSVFASY